MASLIRWTSNPHRDLAGVRDDVDRLFESVFKPVNSAGVPLPLILSPSVDIAESQDGFVITMDLPGVNQSEVKVSLLGEVLTLKGERKQPAPEQGLAQHRAERRYGTFERSFSLGVAVRADQVKASMRDGVLEIRVPKAEEAKVREIEVQVAS